MSISVGAVGTASTVVTPENTAAAVGSGSLPVFATPYMIALMENAACNAIADALEDGQSSVGTKLDVSHDAATPVGMHVTAAASCSASRRPTMPVRSVRARTSVSSSWPRSFSPRRRRKRAESRAFRRKIADRAAIEKKFTESASLLPQNRLSCI